MKKTKVACQISSYTIGPGLVGAAIGEQDLNGSVGQNFVLQRVIEGT